MRNTSDDLHIGTFNRTAGTYRQLHRTDQTPTHILAKLDLTPPKKRSSNLAANPRLTNGRAERKPATGAPSA